MIHIMSRLIPPHLAIYLNQKDGAVTPFVPSVRPASSNILIGWYKDQIGFDASFINSREVISYTARMFTEIYCIVSGKVQRVGYRDFVQRMAKERGLKGWVKNREDGTVEILAQGYPDDLKACIEALHTGSVLAKVDSVAVDWRTPKHQFDDFSVLIS